MRFLQKVIEKRALHRISLYEVHPYAPHNSTGIYLVLALEELKEKKGLLFVTEEWTHVHDLQRFDFSFYDKQDELITISKQLFSDITDARGY